MLFLWLFVAEEIGPDRFALPFRADEAFLMDKVSSFYNFSAIRVFVMMFCCVWVGLGMPLVPPGALGFLPAAFILELGLQSLKLT